MASVTAPAPAVTYKGRGRDKPSLGRQLVLQAACLFILFTVMFPVLWIVSMAIDPRNLSRPDGLNLIPPGASLDSFINVIRKPTSNPVDFVTLAFNSFKIASITSLFSILIGVSAAYAFSRFKFAFRAFLMILILGVLMLPAVATLAPLFVFLNGIKVDFTGVPILGPLLGNFNLRNSQLGVMLAITSGLLPFAIWNLKGYLDTIPQELEEAAAVDGASRNATFFKIILPLATPALAVTGFLGFIGGWTEFYFSWMFLTKPQDFTLAMALYSMVGNYARTTPWSMFAAFAILVAIPPAVVYFFAQKYIVSGLAIGGVKG
jgi:arabinogalactan oligomer/maltooligosaccharide transport system permease protein